MVLDLTVQDEASLSARTDFDVGIRLGEFVEADMVAVRLSAPQRQIAAASPAYLARRGTPKVPVDLLAHDCVNWRRPGSEAPYAWEFCQDGRWFTVAVSGPLIVSDRNLAVTAALDDMGIVFWAEEILAPHLASGRLVPLLADWSSEFPGWKIYFPRQPHMPRAVRAFIDFFSA